MHNEMLRTQKEPFLGLIKVNKCLLTLEKALWANACCSTYDTENVKRPLFKANKSKMIALTTEKALWANT